MTMPRWRPRSRVSREGSQASPMPTTSSAPQPAMASPLFNGTVTWRSSRRAGRTSSPREDVARWCTPARKASARTLPRSAAPSVRPSAWSICGCQNVSATRTARSWEPTRARARARPAVTTRKWSGGGRCASGAASPLRRRRGVGLQLRPCRQFSAPSPILRIRSLARFVVCALFGPGAQQQIVARVLVQEDRIGMDIRWILEGRHRQKEAPRRVR